MVRHVMVTGGTGYIGSHTVVLLVEAGYEVTIVDSLRNSSDKVLGRIAEITGKPEAVTFVNVSQLRVQSERWTTRRKRGREASMMEVIAQCTIISSSDERKRSLYPHNLHSLYPLCVF
jgi:UDP-glucose 4-epimerase